QLPTLLLRQLHKHGVEQSAVDDSADVPGQLVERAESGQLKALPYELLYGHVDQVGRVVHDLGGAVRGFDSHVSCLATPATNIDEILPRGHVDLGEFFGCGPAFEPWVSRSLQGGHRITSN